MYSRKYYIIPTNSTPMEIREILIQREFTFGSERGYITLKANNGGIYLSQRRYEFTSNDINTNKNRKLILILAKFYFTDSQFEKMCESISEHFYYSHE